MSEAAGRNQPAARLPSGTVTMLFTDVEASTSLATRLRERYGDVLAEHRRLLRDAVIGHGGLEVDAQGDELFAVFTRARDAVAAAAATQLALAAHPWPDDAPVRVRMGVHTGEPAQRDDSYVGVEVHRASRICAAGRGGQVLVSSTTAGLVRDDVPVGVTLCDLGERRLKGLERPERVWELLVEGVPEEAAAAPRADAGDDRVRVVLADDSVLLREGIARLLEASGFDVVGQVDNPDDLLRRIAYSKPAVAIVDIRMPPTHTDEGLRAAREIRARHPGVGVLVLSQFVEPQYALELLGETSEGTGYLLKDRVSDVEEFTDAIRRVARGGSALDPAVVSQLVAPRRRDDPLAVLTPREREVLGLMAEGLSNQGIAQRIVVTERAVEKHVTSIFGKLRLTAAPVDHRRVQAVLAFLNA
jgi:DNA-binding NarL/FixJ family response regulator/class 3 adenylate cyclase